MYGAVPVFVPDVCHACYNYDPGEYSDYALLSGPYCEKNVWFPTRTNKCAKQDRIKMRGAL